MSIPACLNYIGSKKKLLTSIDKIVLSINNEIKSTKPLHFLDGFAGSGIVGKYFNNLIAKQEKINPEYSGITLQEFEQIRSNELLDTPTNVVDGTGNIKNYSMKEEEE